VRDAIVAAAKGILSIELLQQMPGLAAVDMGLRMMMILFETPS